MHTVHFIKYIYVTVQHGGGLVICVCVVVVGGGMCVLRLPN